MYSNRGSVYAAWVVKHSHSYPNYVNHKFQQGYQIEKWTLNLQMHSSDLSCVYVPTNSSSAAIHREYPYMCVWVFCAFCFHEYFFNILLPWTFYFHEYFNILHSRMLLQHLFENSYWNHVTLRRTIWLCLGPHPGASIPMAFPWESTSETAEGGANAPKIRYQTNLWFFNED